jgi:uncharacterized protein
VFLSHKTLFILNPYRFGPAAHQLFGLLHTPPQSSARQHTVLLCNPFGQEAIRVHRLLRVLAERLARAGFHVMRFDYLGTGDSDGADDEGDFRNWTDDVLCANNEAQRLSGNSRCSWFGLRLGASLAMSAWAACEQTSGPPEQLVLWDPVVNGSDYLSELAHAHAAELKSVHANPHKRYSTDEILGETEVLGFPVKPALREQLLTFSPNTWAVSAVMKTTKIQLITGPGAQNTVALAQHLSTAGCQVHQHTISTHIVWASGEAMNTAIVPTQAMQAIVQTFVEAT